jgi:hypothetical protein
MDAPHTVSAIPAAEAEEFFTTGTPAYQAEKQLTANSSQLTGPCCTGVDLPGVGFRHAASCTETPDAITSFPGDSPALGASLLRLLNDEPPADLTWRERDDPRAAAVMPSGAHHAFFPALLVTDLMVAARDVAEANIYSYNEKLRCKTCGHAAHTGRNLAHAKNCNTGRIFELFAALMAERVANSNLKQKEVLPKAAIPGAGMGARPQWQNERQCGLCGEIGGMWQAEARPKPSVKLSLLAQNQCVGASVNGRGHTLYTHLCKGGAQ